MFETLAIKLAAAVLVVMLAFGGGYGCSWARTRDQIAKVKADRAVIESQLRTIADAQAKTEIELKVAREKAADIRIVTTERIREIQAEGIPPGCDAAMDFLRAEAARIRNRERHGVED